MCLFLLPYHAGSPVKLELGNGRGVCALQLQSRRSRTQVVTPEGLCPFSLPLLMCFISAGLAARFNGLCREQITQETHTIDQPCAPRLICDRAAWVRDGHRFLILPRACPKAPNSCYWHQSRGGPKGRQVKKTHVGRCTGH